FKSECFLTNSSKAPWAWLVRRISVNLTYLFLPSTKNEFAPAALAQLIENRPGFGMLDLRALVNAIAHPSGSFRIAMCDVADDRLDVARRFFGPFTDPSLHLLVRNNATLFDVALSLAHRNEKRDFVSSVTIIDVVWESIYGLKFTILPAQ